MRRVMVILLQEKNFGPNVIYCVGTDYKWLIIDASYQE